MDNEPKVEETSSELDNSQNEMMPPSNSGCMKQFGKGCLITVVVMLILGSIGAVVMYRRIQDAGGWTPYLNKKSAEYMQYAVKANIEKLPLNKNEKESITEPMTILAEKMRTGQIDTARSVKLVQAAYHTILPEVLMVLSFQAKRVKPENRAASLTVNRVLNGLLDGKLTAESMNKFNEIVLNNPEQFSKIHSYEGENQDPGKGIEFKELSDEDVDLALRMLGEIADGAGLPATRKDLNFTPIITKLIDSLEAESSSKETSADKKAEPK